MKRSKTFSSFNEKKIIANKDQGPKMPDQRENKTNRKEEKENRPTDGRTDGQKVASKQASKQGKGRWSSLNTVQWLVYIFNISTKWTNKEQRYYWSFEGTVWPVFHGLWFEKKKVGEKNLFFHSGTTIDRASERRTTNELTNERVAPDFMDRRNEQAKIAHGYPPVFTTFSLCSKYVRSICIRYY